MKKTDALELVVHYPQGEEEKLALARRVADVHAQIAARQLRGLHCPAEQKLALAKAVMERVKRGN